MRVFRGGRGKSMWTDGVGLTKDNAMTANTKSAFVAVGQFPADVRNRPQASTTPRSDLPCLHEVGGHCAPSRWTCSRTEVLSSSGLSTATRPHCDCCLATGGFEHRLTVRSDSDLGPFQSETDEVCVGAGRRVCTPLSVCSPGELHGTQFGNTGVSFFVSFVMFARVSGS